jgi:glucan phosphoethanolaminetransferase (alkaline phosphatase superfamily)
MDEKPLSDKNDVATKLYTNALLWMVFVIVYFGYYIVSHDLKNGENIPKVEVYGLINWGVFISLLVAAFIVFGMFSMVKHKSRTKNLLNVVTLY